MVVCGQLKIAVSGKYEGLAVDQTVRYYLNAETQQVQGGAGGGPERWQDLHHLPLYSRLLRVHRQRTPRLTQPTVGIDFVTKTMQVEGETLRLQLWDTAGQ